jgi:hypothetical protein
MNAVKIIKSHLFDIRTWREKNYSKCKNNVGVMICSLLEFAMEKINQHQNTNDNY